MSGNVTFGIEVHPALPAMEIVDWIVELERAGLDEVWLADTHMIMREVFAIMGAAAVRTERVLLGTGVTQPVTRHATVIASVMATLEELAPGRILCGIGLGDSAVETIGLRPVRRKELEDTVDLLRSLWSGTDVATNNEVTLEIPWWRGGQIPIYYASSGPKMLADAGRLADGVIAYVGTTTKKIRAATGLVSAAAEQDGRTWSDADFVLWVPFGVHEDAAEAVWGVKAHAARAILHGASSQRDEDEERVALNLKSVYDYSEHMDPDAAHNALVPDEIALRYAVAGTPMDCVEQLYRIHQETDVSRFGLIPMGRDRRLIARRAAESVIPEVRARIQLGSAARP